MGAWSWRGWLSPFTSSRAVRASKPRTRMSCNLSLEFPRPLLGERLLGIDYYCEWKLAQQRPGNSRDKLRDMRVRRREGDRARPR